MQGGIQQLFHIHPATHTHSDTHTKTQINTHAYTQTQTHTQSNNTRRHAVGCNMTSNVNSFHLPKPEANLSGLVASSLRSFENLQSRKTSKKTFGNWRFLMQGDCQEIAQVSSSNHILTSAIDLSETFYRENIENWK